MTSYSLPDGRTLIVEPATDPGYWHCVLVDKAQDEIIGRPLNSTLAELLGSAVAHDEWPAWVDELATEIEQSLGVSS